MNEVPQKETKIEFAISETKKRLANIEKEIAMMTAEKETLQSQITMLEQIQANEELE